MPRLKPHQSCGEYVVRWRRGLALAMMHPILDVKEVDSRTVARTLSLVMMMDMMMTSPGSSRVCAGTGQSSLLA